MKNSKSKAIRRKLAPCVLMLFGFLFIKCTNYKIETLKIIRRGPEGYDTAVFHHEKQYLTKKQVKEFERKGLNSRDKNLFKIYHIIYYVWIKDTILVEASDGYYYTDDNVGKEKVYYPDGKISVERNYIIMNDSTGKVITMEDFSKMMKNKEQKGLEYYGEPDGVWKYYSEEGKLIKEEIYDKGKLGKTINY